MAGKLFKDLPFYEHWNDLADKFEANSTVDAIKPVNFNKEDK